jgi:hypothetical protein
LSKDRFEFARAYSVQLSTLAVSVACAPYAGNSTSLGLWARPPAPEAQPLSSNKTALPASQRLAAQRGGRAANDAGVVPGTAGVSTADEAQPLFSKEAALPASQRLAAQRAGRAANDAGVSPAVRRNSTTELRNSKSAFRTNASLTSALGTGELCGRVASWGWSVL